MTAAQLQREHFKVALLVQVVGQRYIALLHTHFHFVVGGGCEGSQEISVLGIGHVGAQLPAVLELTARVKGPLRQVRGDRRGV